VGELRGVDGRIAVLSNGDALFFKRIMFSITCLAQQLRGTESAKSDEARFLNLTGDHDAKSSLDHAVVRGPHARRCRVSARNEHAEHDHAEAGHAQAGGHTCGCGEVDGPGHPELDARAVPHAIRHATIFGALDAVKPGGGMVLVAPHDPLPLLAQVERRYDGAFEVDYLERGPERWRLTFVRRTAA
jgi:uncharacterized protein (DUF2249 family)